jgi:Phage major capsid protein E
MPTLDIFNGKAFSMVELTTAVNKNPYKPGFIGSLNLFDDKPIRTTAAAIELKDGALNLIQTSERGAPLEEGENEKRNIYYQPTVRIAKGRTIMADEVQSVRSFGSETELMQVMQLVTDQLNGPTGLIAEVEMTWENMRLGAVQGIVTDADSSVLVDWSSVFGVSLPTEIDFDLDNATPASGAVRKQCSKVTRGVRRALGGLWVTGQSRIVGLCGDNFWDDITAHKEVRETFLGTQQAADLRRDIAFESFRYGGIEFVNYQGTDDNTTVAIGVDKCKFVPIGVPGLFERALSPAETMTYVNTPGLPMYAMTIVDRERDMWVRPEVYSYPLFICTRPAALHSARRT